MNALGEIEIRIEGNVGAQRLTPGLVDLLDQDPTYSQAYLDGLLQRAAPAWADIDDPDAWLKELRGGPDA